MATNETVKVVRKVLRAREQKATRASDAVDAGDARARATATNDELDATATVAAREEAYRLARERIFGDEDEDDGDDGEDETTTTTTTTTTTNDGNDGNALDVRGDGADASMGRERGNGGSGMSASARAFAPKKATRKDRWADSFDPDFIRRDPSVGSARMVPMNVPGVMPMMMPPPMGGMTWQQAAPSYFAPPMPPPMPPGPPPPRPSRERGDDV